MTSSVIQTEVMSRAEARGLITEIFEETALVLGGLVAVHRVDDDFVWRLIKGLDAVCSKTFRRIDERDTTVEVDTADGEIRLRPHPAIEDFLLKLRRS